MSYSALEVRMGLVSATVILLLAAAAGCSGSSSSAPSALTPAVGNARVAPAGWASTNYTFTRLDNPNDPNQTILTGINNEDKITGYYGDGSNKHPYTGFIVRKPYGSHNFQKEDYPTAHGTFVTSLNNRKAIAGYFIDKVVHNWLYGFIYTGGIWTEYKDPALRKGKSNITQLLGLNDAGLAPGFYQDDAGVNHAFELNEQTGKYHAIIPPQLLSVKATGINGKGDICGYGTVASGATISFMLKGGSFTLFAYTGSLDTEALAINWQDQLVGKYVDVEGATHGFILSNPLASQVWQSIDEPNSTGKTVITSIEDHRNLVGYYADSAGNTHGFLGTFVSK